MSLAVDRVRKIDKQLCQIWYKSVQGACVEINEI